MILFQPVNSDICIILLSRYIILISYFIGLYFQINTYIYVKIKFEVDFFTIVLKRSNKICAILQ